MSCETITFDVYECALCGTQFEQGVSDCDATGAERCPQCGFSEARPITAAELGEFVVTRATKFR
jgi:DNA-directed RNA polymerase subunit RPC12/RpoP